MKKEIIPTLKLALPMICTEILGYSQAVVDTVMAGRHNALTLAAVSLAAQVFALVFFLFNGIAIAFSAQFSRYNGADDRKNLVFCFQQGVWIFIFIGILTAILMYLAALILPYLGTKEEIAVQCRQYLIILAIPSGILIFSSIATAFLQGMAYPRTVNILMTMLLPVNIIGNWYFLNYTDLEAAGMAIATGISYIIYALIIFFILIKSSRWRKYHLFKVPFSFDFKACLRLLSLGFPIGIAIFLEGGLFSFIGIMASRENTITTAANQIAGNFISIIFMVPLGISAALTIRIAHAYGQKNLITLKNRAVIGLVLSAGFMICAALFNYFLREKIASFYSSDQDVLILATKIMLVACVFQVLDGLQVAVSGILRGLGDTKILMLFAIFCYWLIGVPVGLFISYPLEQGIVGLWIGCATGVMLFAFLGLLRLRYKLFKIQNINE